jgi:hypothetical protein
VTAVKPSDCLMDRQTVKLNDQPGGPQKQNITVDLLKLRFI